MSSLSSSAGSSSGEVAMASVPVPISPLRKVGRLGAGLLFRERKSVDGRHLAFGGRGSSGVTSFSGASRGSELNRTYGFSSAPNGQFAGRDERHGGGGDLVAGFAGTAAGGDDVDMDMDGEPFVGGSGAMQSSLPASSAMDLIKERRSGGAVLQRGGLGAGGAEEKGMPRSGVPVLAHTAAAAAAAAAAMEAVGGVSGMSYSLPSPGFALASASASASASARGPSRSAAAALPRLVKHSSDGAGELWDGGEGNGEGKRGSVALGFNVAWVLPASVAAPPRKRKPSVAPHRNATQHNTTQRKAPFPTLTAASTTQTATTAYARQQQQQQQQQQRQHQRQQQQQQQQQQRNTGRVRSKDDLARIRVEHQRRAKMARAMKALYVMKIAEMDGDLHEVVPRLFIGSVGASTDLGKLQRHGVTHVVVAGAGLVRYHPNALTYFQIAIGDRPEAARDLASHLPSAMVFINGALAAGGSVLVHCFAGKSRSASVVVAWLMLTRGWTMNQALTFLRQRRPVCQPNVGFVVELKKLERDMGPLQRAIGMTSGGVGVGGAVVAGAAAGGAAGGGGGAAASAASAASDAKATATAGKARE